MDLVTLSKELHPESEKFILLLMGPDITKTSKNEQLLFDECEDHVGHIKLWSTLKPWMLDNESIMKNIVDAIHDRLQPFSPIKHYILDCNIESPGIIELVVDFNNNSH